MNYYEEEELDTLDDEEMEDEDIDEVWMDKQ